MPSVPPLPSIHSSPWYPAWNTCDREVDYPYISEAIAEDAYVHSEPISIRAGSDPYDVCVIAGGDGTLPRFPVVVYGRTGTEQR